MNLFGIGPLEIFFILIIALIVLGPRDMAKAGRTIGRFLRRLAISREWRLVQQASREIRYLPNRLMREAGLEEDIQEFERLRRIGQEFSQDFQRWQNDLNLSAWTKPPSALEEGQEAVSDSQETS